MFYLVLSIVLNQIKIFKRTSLKRIGKVSEISKVIKLLASEEGSYITGQNIKVDGGITRAI